VQEDHNQAGSAGSKSNVSILPNTTAVNVALSSGNTAAVGGSSATGTSAAGETAMTTTVAAFASLANFISTLGVTSVGSTTLPSGPNITPFSSQLVTQGAAGGAGETNAINGASILSSSITPLISGGIGTIVSGSIGGNGADGITSWKPFFSTGGAGGGNSVSGSGGKGGNGGIGSGGGAGGGFKSGFTGGVGGKGGDGLVVIISF